MLNYFAENFSAYLKVRGISQSEFSRLFGVKANTVNQWANGKREPDLDTVCKICILFDVSLDEMIGYNKTIRKHKTGVLREIIGGNSNFQREQAQITKKMFEEGKTIIEIQKVVNNFYEEKYKEYQKIFGFQD